MKLGIGLSLTRQRILGSVFLPSDISNLDLWYDFSTISGSTGDNVTSFANGGNAGSDYNLSQDTASDIPTLNTSEMSLNSLDFQSGSTTNDDSLALDNTYITTGKTFSVFVVFELSNVGAGKDTDTFLAGTNGGNNQFGLFNHKNVTTRFNSNASGNMNTVENTITDTTSEDAQYTGGSTTTTSYTFGEDPEILLITRDASNTVKIYNKAGALVGISTSYTDEHADTNFEIAHIGSFHNGSTPANGFIGEIGVYNKTLSASEVSDLITHLADKWSIS